MSKETEKPAPTPAELQAFNEQRAAVYGFLARLYRCEVDQGLLDVLVESTYPAQLGNSDAEAGYYKMARFLSNLWENSLDELAIDYSRCFIGHGIDAHGAAYPYESVYTSEKRLMMQQARDEVLAIYRSEGVDKAEGWKENEDHVALELEFMEIMCERAARKFSQGDIDAAMADMRTQQGFLAAHLAPWVPAFNADVREFAKTDFYFGLACIADGELAMDAQALEEVLGPVDIEEAEAAEDGESAE